MRTRYLAGLAVWVIVACGAPVDGPSDKSKELQVSSKTTEDGLGQAVPLQPSDWVLIAPGVERRVTESGGIMHRALDERGVKWIADSITRELLQAKESLTHQPSQVLRERVLDLSQSLETVTKLILDSSSFQPVASEAYAPSQLVCVESASTSGSAGCGCDRVAPFGGFGWATASAEWEGCGVPLDASVEATVNSSVDRASRFSSAGYIGASQYRSAVPGAFLVLVANSSVSTTPKTVFSLVQTCKIPNPCPNCTTSADCPDPASPVCSSAGRCSACTNDAECKAKDPNAPICSAGKCVACGSSATCPSRVPICDEILNYCRSCRGDTECKAKTAALPPWSQTPYCGGYTYTCVQCEQDSHCSGATPHCDIWRSWKCVP